MPGWKMATYNFKFNFVPFFQKEAKNLVSQYRSLLTRRKGVSLDAAPPNKPSTVEIKGKDHWLVDTGESRAKGILEKHGNGGFEIYASPSRHSGKRTYFGVPGGHKGQRPGVHRAHTEKRIIQAKNPPTYEQIFSWHNQDRYSGIFSKLPVGSQMPQRFKREYMKQLRPQVEEAFSRDIEVSIG